MTAGIGGLAVARIDNIITVYGLLVLAGLGIGGIVVPASIITTIVCPDDLIATVTAISICVRVLGGCIGYSVYYNVFANQFIRKAKFYIGGQLIKFGIFDYKVTTEIIELTAASLVEEIALVPGIRGNQTRYELVIKAGQLAYAESYRYVYLVSIAFGTASIVASCFLGDIEKYMDDHVAVVI
ncbi:MAG: hypothetical protein M1814_003767 [Vezdaea aestivalis]|nr:MAG: hypothetical protein M1814_003767 [Vezdaea aestivalis]